MPISHSSTISIEWMLLLCAILTEKSINVGKIILKEIHDCAKKKARSGKKSQLSWIQGTQQMELKLKLIQSQTLKRKNLIRNRTFLNQGSQMLSLRHGRKILTMQAEMELKKTRGMS
ncbi:hypothetical protein Gotur_018498 [Gossypium turneri]